MDELNCRLACQNNVLSRTIQQKSSPELAPGQVWQLKHAYIFIVELGQRLLHYKMLDFPGQKGVRTQMSTVDVMWHYLRSRHAQLVKADAV